MAKTKWVPIPDSDVLMVYRCTRNGCSQKDKTVIVAPCNFAECGLPVCPKCGEKLPYVGCEVKLTDQTTCALALEAQQKQSKITINLGGAST